MANSTDTSFVSSVYEEYRRRVVVAIYERLPADLAKMSRDYLCPASDGDWIYCVMPIGRTVTAAYGEDRAWITFEGFGPRITTTLDSNGQPAIVPSWTPEMVTMSPALITERFTRMQRTSPEAARVLGPELCAGYVAATWQEPCVRWRGPLPDPCVL